MEWYPKVLRLVNSAFPALRLTREHNLILLTYAILRQRTLCQAKLAWAFPGKAKHHHKKKRLHRFGTNTMVSLLLQLVPTIMKRFGLGEGRVAVNLDWTPLRAQEQALFASLLLEGRALPLLFWATSFAQIRQGTSQNDLEEALVRRLVLALPRGVRSVLLADRGFGRVSFLLFLQRLARDLGCLTSFVIRLSDRVMVEQGGRRGLLGEWPLERGELLFLERAQLRQDAAVRVNLVL